jgi:hypothetical protein
VRLAGEIREYMGRGTIFPRPSGSFVAGLP